MPAPSVRNLHSTSEAAVHLPGASGDRAARRLRRHHPPRLPRLLFPEFARSPRYSARHTKMLRVNHVSCGRVAMPRPTPVRANVARSQRALYTRGPSCRAPLTRSISAPPPRANFAPRMHHSTEPVRLSDEYTYFADRIEKRYVSSAAIVCAFIPSCSARWERIRNWVVFGGSAALGSAVAEATIVLSGLAPPDTIGTQRMSSSSAQAHALRRCWPGIWRHRPW